jgi:hypothetical protein
MIDRGSKKGHTLAILTLWCIWNWRNAAVFNNKTCTAEQVFGQSAKKPSYGLILVEKLLDPSLLATTLGEYS